MLFLVLAGFVLIFAIMCFARHGILKTRGERTDYDAGCVVLSFCVLLIIMIGFSVSGAMWSEQVSDFENVKMYQKVEAIYKAKAEILTKEFAQYLAETYPDHEKDIYSKISPDKVHLYFAKYPELKASKTLVVLVDRINKLQSDVYDQKINVEQALKNTRFRLRNPWLFTFMIPLE